MISGTSQWEVPEVINHYCVVLEVVLTFSGFHSQQFMLSRVNIRWIKPFSLATIYAALREYTMEQNVLYPSKRYQNSFRISEYDRIILRILQTGFSVFMISYHILSPVARGLCALFVTNCFRSQLGLLPIQQLIEATVVKKPFQHQ